MRRRVIGVTVLLVYGAFAGVARASPASGVTPTVLSRGSYEEFKVKSSSDELDFKAMARATDKPKSDDDLDLEAQAEPAIDIVVREHVYVAGSTTGWHTHPGPVFITVVEGELTVYERDDPSCTPRVLVAGQGYVDSGRGHVVRNESGAPAKDVTVIIAPVGLPFRAELYAPWPPCGF